eukprot:838857-Pelagomonas_calceolata.AAC.2
MDYANFLEGHFFQPLGNLSMGCHLHCHQGITKRKGAVLVQCTASAFPTLPGFSHEASKQARHKARKIIFSYTRHRKASCLKLQISTVSAHILCTFLCCYKPAHQASEREPGMAVSSTSLADHNTNALLRMSECMRLYILAP